jgi:hypothetical protein
LLTLISAAIVGFSAAHGDSSSERQQLAACKAGSVPASIGGAHVCLEVGSKCKARYESAYERKGFRCVAGRLQKKRKPPPPPAPPPPAKAMPGLYRFSTSQCTFPTLCNMGTLRVQDDGLSLTDIVIPYSATCTPPRPWTDVLTSNQGAVVTLDADLGFNINGSGSFSGGSFTLVSTGRFDTAGNVSGSFDVHVSGNDSGGNYACDTGTVTFSGKLQPPS